QFVRDRCRQLAHCGSPIQVRSGRQVLPGLYFCKTSAISLVQQHDDEHGLDEACGHGHHDGTPVITPQRKAPEFDAASRWKTRLCNVPALELTRVEFKRRVRFERYLAVRHAFAADVLDDVLAQELPHLPHVTQPPADDAAAEFVGG